MESIGEKLVAVASGNLADGSKVIVNANGTVSVIEGAGLGSRTAIGGGGEDASYDMAATFDSNSNKVVIAYDDPANNEYGTAIVGTVSGSSISFGSPVVFESAVVRQTTTTFDSNSNKVVIAYIDNGNSSKGTAIVGTVSGTGISFGSPVIFDSGTVGRVSTTFDSNSNKVVIFWRNASNLGKAIVGTVSGTGISFGSAATFNNANTYFFPTSSTFDSNSNKVVIAFRDIGGSNNGEAIVGTVSGTSISFGSPAEYDDGAHNYQTLVFDSNSNKVVITFQKNSDSGRGRSIVATVSGTSISFGTAVLYDSATNSGAIAKASFDAGINKVIVMYVPSGSPALGYYIIGTVSGTGISFGSRQSILPSNAVSLFASTFDSNSNKTVMAYYRAGSSSGKKAGVYSGSSTLTAENYIGISDGVYASGADATVQLVGSIDDAQTSLTAGQTYFVQTDGTLGTSADDPSVVAGTAISATKLIVKG